MALYRMGSSESGMLVTMEAARQLVGVQMAALRAEVSEMIATTPHSKYDMGMWTFSLKSPVYRALSSVVNGFRFGYPPCCIEEFAIDVLEGRSPSLRRGHVNMERPGSRYVPCTACCEAMGRVTCEEYEEESSASNGHPRAVQRSAHAV